MEIGTERVRIPLAGGGSMIAGHQRHFDSFVHCFKIPSPQSASGE